MTHHPYPWDAIREAAKSLDLAYRDNAARGEVDPGALVELAEALQRAMVDSTTDPRVQAVAALVESVGAAARLLTADRRAQLQTIADLREQVAAERAFMRTTVAAMASEVARLTIALGESVGYAGKLTARVEAIGAGGAA